MSRRKGGDSLGSTFVIGSRLNYRQAAGKFSDKMGAKPITMRKRQASSIGNRKAKVTLAPVRFIQGAD